MCWMLLALTVAAYGDVQEFSFPVREEEALRPMSFYGVK